MLLMMIMKVEKRITIIRLPRCVNSQHSASQNSEDIRHQTLVIIQYQ